MYPFSVATQLLCWFKCCFPWAYHDYWSEIDPEYWNMFKYVVATPSDYKALDDKEPRRNVKQVLWKSIKSVIVRNKRANPDFTPDIVEWIHKDELVRMLSNPKSKEGEWRTKRPYCWELAWKCIVIFSMKNKYGINYYTIVDVCSMQHLAGVIKEGKVWQDRLLDVIRNYKPMRIYATDSSPFTVKNLDYYMTLSICGFLEVYLEPEKELRYLLLNKVWPEHIVRVKYMIENLICQEYCFRRNSEIHIDTSKWDILDGEFKKPSKLKFLERTKRSPGKWVLKEVNRYLKWKERKKVEWKQLKNEAETSFLNDCKSKTPEVSTIEKRELKTPFNGMFTELGLLTEEFSDKVKQEEKERLLIPKIEGRKDWLGIKELFTAINHDINSRKGIPRICSSTQKIRKTYSEFLWKRETYLNERESTGIFFPSVLNFRFKEEGESLLLNSSKEEVDIYLKYRRYWTKWSPLLIFSDDGTLYMNPAKELVKKEFEKIEQAKYEAEVEIFKNLPKTRWGVLFSEVGLPIHLQHLYIDENMGSNFENKRKNAKDLRQSLLFKKKRKREAKRYWNEREEFNKKWTSQEWVERIVDRRKYASGYEWLKFKYPSLFTNVNEKWQDILSEDYLSEIYLNASKNPEHS